MSNEDVALLIQKISLRVIKYLRNKGYIDRDGDVIQGPDPDSLFQDYDSLTQASAVPFQIKLHSVLTQESMFNAWELPYN